MCNVLGYGHIHPRTGVNAYRIRTAKKACILDLLQHVNSKLLTLDKQIQVFNICKKWNISFISSTQVEAINIIRNTAWLSGFFDAEGSLVIHNKVTLIISIPQKDRAILDLINSALDPERCRIYSNTSDGTLKLGIFNREGIRLILKRFITFKLHTTK